MGRSKSLHYLVFGGGPEKWNKQKERRQKKSSFSGWTRSTRTTPEKEDLELEFWTMKAEMCRFNYGQN